MAGTPTPAELIRFRKGDDLMNPLAEELNGILRREAPELLNSLSHYGEKLFFPKGILAQTQEASTKAHKFNAI